MNIDLDDKNIDQLIDSLKLPPIPTTLRELQTELQKEYPELPRVAEIVQKDAALAGLLLKLVNSPLFPITAEVISVNQAINLLGFKSLSSMVTGLLVKQSFSADEAIAETLWLSQMNTACASIYLAKRLLSCCNDEAYLVGLFSNCGQMLMASRHADYAEVLQAFDPAGQQTLAEYEETCYPYHHAKLSCLLAYSWGIPKPLCEVVLHHHEAQNWLDGGTLESEKNLPKQMMAIFKIAEYADRRYNAVEICQEWENVKDLVSGYLLLSDVDLDELLLDLDEKLSGVA